MTEMTQPGPQVVAEPESSSLGMSTWRITEWFREYRNSRPGGGTYGDAVTKLNRVTTTMYDDQTLAACWTLAAGEPPTREPAAVTDIPAGQGPASLFILSDDDGQPGVWHKDSAGRVHAVYRRPFPHYAGDDALWEHLAATLPHVTDEETP